jgi:ribosomal protein S18 acetylase RimI-like enzyme
MPLLRAYHPSDRAAVLGLLASLSARYPGATEWLQRRLTDVEEGQARCTVVEVDGTLGAVMIETPKPPHQIKMSTLYVSEDCRHMGLAQLLIRHAQPLWAKEGITRVYSSVDSSHPSLPFYTKLGWVVTDVAPGRYAADRDELVVELRGSLGPSATSD